MNQNNSIQIKIRGKRVESENNLNGLSAASYEIERSYILNGDRSSAQSHIIETRSSQILRLTTEDGVEWYTTPDQIPIVTGKDQTGRAQHIIEIDQWTRSRAGQRGWLGNIKNAIIDFIKPKSSEVAANLTVRHIVKKLENKKSPITGVFVVNANNTLGRKAEASEITGRVLLYIHGTNSNHVGAFGNMVPSVFSEIYNHYGGRVYTYEHNTLSESPIKNVVELLSYISSQAEIDIISHSRGGLVGDVLCRCDMRNEQKGFTEEEMKLLIKEFEKGDFIDDLLYPVSEEKDAMEKISSIAAQKNIRVQRHVRVGCPASGTVLLADRLDVWCNSILNLIGGISGAGAHPLYAITQEFLLDIIQSRTRAEVIPGLWSMVPQSTYQKINNNDFSLHCNTVCITGDSNVSKSHILQSLAVILSNLYYRQGNDFVVNTSAMSLGLQARKSFITFAVPHDAIHHFCYFSLPESADLVRRSILLNIDELSLLPRASRSPSDGSRGVVLDAFDKGSLYPEEPSGDREIVILIPGIMGSNLYEHKDEKLWLDLRDISNGAIPNKMKHSQKLEPRSAIKEYYDQLTYHIKEKENKDVLVFPFDWRISLSRSVKNLKEKLSDLLDTNQAIHIISHSMGGLLVRQLMHDEKDGVWSRWRAKPHNKWIMLGTPWRGSHLIVELLLGHSSRVKQLSILDTKHNLKELLHTFYAYEGVYELLPLDDERLLLKEKWEEYISIVGKHKLPSASRLKLSHYTDYVSQWKDYSIPADDVDHIYYIAGKADETISGFDKDHSWWKGDYIHYSRTRSGDGSVTYDSGIPRDLHREHIYFVDTGHGSLAADPTLFYGLGDILRDGRTDDVAFHQTPNFPSSRSTATMTAVGGADQIIDYYDRSKASNRIMGIPDEAYKQKSPTDRIHISILNGDLKWSDNPVMVGHFHGDGVVSAEEALDTYLNGKLSERHLLGFYPGKIGEQAIIYDPEDTPSGAVIVGLGLKDELTGYLLAKTVEKAILKYALFHRDNYHSLHNDAMTSISTLMIGSAYGRLPRKESIRSIILGVQNANATLGSLNQDYSQLKPITDIQFVDYYEDNAYECYKLLKELEREGSGLYINVDNDIVEGLGSRKRFLRDESDNWWQSFTTELKYEDPTTRSYPYLAYTTYNGLSSASKDAVRSDLQLAEHLAEELSKYTKWDEKAAKVIFELLLPNRYKDFVRNHRNLEWRMDEYSAQFPWEMFHDNMYGSTPTFIESGLIRQLYLGEARLQPTLVNTKDALVVGDPIFDPKFLGQLPGAKIEAQFVGNLLKQNGYTTKELISSNALDVTTALFANRYKILHIASHGIYETQNEHGKERIGIAIGGRQLLTPGTLSQLSAIPELAFINCCYSGDTDSANKAHSQYRHKLAANVGTELIRKGVKAVVIAGWAIDDAAAQTFAQTFYEQMLAGATFGTAVKYARRQCYESHEEVNTWGAYQCYGDQFYRLRVKKAYDSSKQEHPIQKEILLELHNILSKTRSIDMTREESRYGKDLYNDTQFLNEKATELGKLSPAILECEAEIYYYLGKYADALDRYELLFSLDSGDYRVKSVDRYVNVKAKHLVRQFIADEKPRQKQADEIVAMLKVKRNFNKGAAWYSNVGSTLKRVAILSEKLPDKRDTLRDAAKNYLKAAQLKGLESRDSIYYITSYITLVTLADSGVNDQFDIKEDIGMSAKEYLNQWIVAVKELGNAKYNVWYELSQIQLYMTQLIISHDHTKKEDEALTAEIIDLYSQKLEGHLNIKIFTGELEHVLFLVHIIDEFKMYKQKKKHLKVIQNFLDDFVGGGE